MILLENMSLAEKLEMATIDALSLAVAHLASRSRF